MVPFQPLDIRYELAPPPLCFPGPTWYIPLPGMYFIIVQVIFGASLLLNCELFVYMFYLFSG